ncbi:ditrans,polycis-polyprenyl diphosphate synthase SCDLUD_004010 [Saccharomycodes ludwigii]|uniref:ditrans,polycis-polyprenyl diphosphate synthase n=1 Tax=Saccharomycodes ludwigii TaxID=36035 RepID=UPI001E8553DC|nr:hypothetical protein SCDLUD_004010 [Saccharomycodes ludwigii]KAH3899724.1 hypothetical protein SCDLUD_004010 [Saccharomycodes ludwigii]
MVSAKKNINSRPVSSSSSINVSDSSVLIETLVLDDKQQHFKNHVSSLRLRASDAPSSSTISAGAKEQKAEGNNHKNVSLAPSSASSKLDDKFLYTKRYEQVKISFSWHILKTKFIYYVLSLGLVCKIMYYVQNFFINILKVGKIPTHVSFIMDGNRRYAKKLRLPIASGHNAGSLTLYAMVYICKRIGVKALSVYAFSIENFNRSKEEVDTLMALLVQRLDEFVKHTIDEKDQLYGCSIKIIGDRSYFTQDIKRKIERVEKSSAKDHCDFTLYVCCPYTSRNEIYHSLKKNVEKVIEHELEINDIGESTLTNNMFYQQGDDYCVNKCDLLIRTSGHTRLSDYMAWQSHENSTIVFSPTLWPDFTFTEVFFIMFKWSFFATLQQIKVPFTLHSSLYGHFQYLLFYSKSPLKRQNNVSLESLPAPPKSLSIVERN